MCSFSAAFMMLLASSNYSALAFAPATMGSSFLQTRNAVPKFSSTIMQMNLFDRFSRVAKANLNNVLKNMEDPEKILNQAMEDMQVGDICRNILHLTDALTLFSSRQI